MHAVGKLGGYSGLHLLHGGALSSLVLAGGADFSRDALRDVVPRSFAALHANGSIAETRELTYNPWRTLLLGGAFLVLILFSAPPLSRTAFI